MMGNTAVINAVGLTKRALEPIIEGKSALETVVEACRSIPDVQAITILSDAQLQGDYGKRVRSIVKPQPDWSAAALLSAIGEAGAAGGDCFYVYGDCPLLDVALARRMHENHRRYFAEYTFADGYPHGIAPEIIRVDSIPRIARLAKDSDRSVERDTLFTLIQRDINAFDIETEISPVDARLLRVRLHCDTERNTRLVKRFIDAGARDEQSILSLAVDHQELLRTLPAFFEVQITDGVSQEVSYSPYPLLFSGARERRGTMPADRFRDLVSRIGAFCDDAVISPSLWGEPALHPDISEIAAAVTDQANARLLIETSGIGWRPGALEEIARRTSGKVTWIVDLDAATPDLYKKLRGEGWAEAHATAERLIDLFPASVNVQAVRMQSNEDELEQFYATWKSTASHVIIQKYDWFCGVLPQLKVTDLSPIKRDPCWHLKRDMVVLIDGAVPMCKEDLACSSLLGNVFEEDLETIWERGQDVYLRHVRAEYPELCAKCDEYYTYNF
jgi:spiro-SPASM protein